MHEPTNRDAESNGSSVPGQYAEPEITDLDYDGEDRRLRRTRRRAIRTTRRPGRGVTSSAWGCGAGRPDRRGVPRPVAMSEGEAMQGTGSAGQMVFNGIDGATGSYLIPPMGPDELARRIAPPGALTGERRTMPGVDPRDLAQTGWGVLFPAGQDSAIRDALAPLLALRREQAGRRFRELGGDDAIRPTEGVSALLGRLGVGPGPIAPDKAPYYLLLVGTPEEISFRSSSSSGWCSPSAACAWGRPTSTGATPSRWSRRSGARSGGGARRRSSACATRTTWRRRSVAAGWSIRSAPVCGTSTSTTLAGRAPPGGGGGPDAVSRRLRR